MPDSASETSPELAFLRRVADHALEGIWAIDMDGKTTFANHAMAAMLGCTIDELAHASMWDFVEEADRAQAASNLERRRQGIFEEHDFRFRRRDGSFVLTRLETYAIVGPDGRPGGVALVREVTAERRLAADLDASEARLHTALAAARLYTWEFDPATGEATWSDGAAALLGLASTTRVTSALLLAQAHPDDRAALEQRIKAWVTGAPTLVHEYRVIHPGGHVRWLRSSGRAVVSADGSRRIYGVTEDITESHRLAEELLRTRKLEGIGRLAAGIAHDFNNLITAILTSVSFLEDAAASTNEDLVIIRTAATRAGHLIQQLQRFSGKERLSPGQLDLNDLVVDLESMLARLCGERGRLVLELEPALWQVLGDDGALGQVIVQLVANAAEALVRPGRIVITTANVTLGPDESTTAGDFVELSVSDDGPGLDDEARNHLFEPFFTTKEGGVGLGLAACRGLIEQHRGHIQIDTPASGGTRVAMRLPRGEFVEPTPGARPTAPTGATVLLIEDDELVRRTLVRGLAERGFELLVAVDGEDALELVAEHDGPIDFLVTDVVLPGLSGPDVARQLHQRHPELHVLYVSGHHADAVAKAGTDGDAAFLAKPYSVDALVARLGALRG